MTDPAKKLLTFCKSAREKGIQIVPDINPHVYMDRDRTITTSERNSRCHVLETVVLGLKKTADENPSQMISRILGSSHEWNVGCLLGYSSASKSLDEVDRKEMWKDELVGFDDGVEIWKELNGSE